jgi:hypothetical protein
MALLSLAIGSFGIGMTEFVVMGLLPQISADLLPDAWASDSADAIARRAGSSRCTPSASSSARRRSRHPSPSIRATA